MYLGNYALQHDYEAECADPSGAEGGLEAMAAPQGFVFSSLNTAEATLKALAEHEVVVEETEEEWPACGREPWAGCPHAPLWSRRKGDHPAVTEWELAYPNGEVLALVVVRRVKPDQQPV